MRLLLSVVLVISLFNFSYAQNLKSPDEFLGYKLGTAFTPSYKVVEYFHYVSNSLTHKVKLETYGFTNEGKELLIAAVSTFENIAQLEEIRKNNLRITGSMNDKPANLTMPTIVWLSYNVHGNEASSTEVSMKLLYELVSGKNVNLNEWLKNTVIIIDPCLNPDGRDRYVNWYNQVVGKKSVANPLAREHNEPWPGGRSNHYYYDLNRDWAWQTQVETQQRIKLYNNWMPEIHCDFHEQYPNSPYYFAPAAEPFHEVITPWQREFQTVIGKNHARYFDANGWLYFTKEVFDLFYPSYGDTYPLYNGSIGMTYEQAGHSRGGLTIQVDDDTLTLEDRIQHHFTTSISTIEAASMNARKINESFKAYFNDTRTNGAGLYKTYVINGQNNNKLLSLLDLFKKNQIEFSYARSGSLIKGYRYNTKNDENYITTSNDVIVSTYQSKGSLVKVLFEPQSKLADSVTYDITAWALPYAYGMDCYALKDKLQGERMPVAINKNKLGNNEYAYLIQYNSFKDAQLLSSLLKNNFKVRFSEKDFSFNKKVYKKGTLIVIKNDNEKKIDQLLSLADLYNANISTVSSGFMESGVDFGSEKVHKLNQLKVALVVDDVSSSTAAGEVWHLFEQQLDYPLVLINVNDLLNGYLNNLDVIIIPDGDYKFLTDKEIILKNWVRQGGKLIALENAVSQMAMGDWGIKIKKAIENTENKTVGYQDIKRYDERERQSIINNIPGAIYKLGIDDSHPLAFGYPDYYFSLKMNSNVIEFLKEGWNVGTIKQENQVAGFVGSNVKSQIKDGSTIAVQEYGSGSIVYFVDDPIFRSFWENGKLLFSNAVFLVGQ